MTPAEALVSELRERGGVFEDYPLRIYLEPTTATTSARLRRVRGRDHWLWKEHANPPGGHGGMDYIMGFRLMQCMQLGLVPDFDVYDAVTWTAPVPLSHASIKANGAPQKIPNFTRGLWKQSRSGVDSEAKGVSPDQGLTVV